MSKTFNKVLGEIQSRLHAPKSQRNTFANYNFRNLEDIMEAVKPLLTELKATITVSDEMVMLGDRFYVKSTATLFSADNEPEVVTAYARETEVKKGMDAAQITGSASSYARKYALNGLLAIDDTKDADSKDNTIGGQNGTKTVEFPSNDSKPPKDAKKGEKSKESTPVLKLTGKPCTKDEYIDALIVQSDKHGIDISDIVAVTDVNKDFADMEVEELMKVGAGLAKAIKSLK